jgi:hypothetical protein
MTRPITILGPSILALVLMSALAPAQSQTGTGRGPASTATAPNTSSVGRVMPPSRGAGAATPNDRRDRTKREVKNDRLMRGICIGCNAR